MSHEAVTDLIFYLDKTNAANIDIKAFNHEVYKKLGGNLDIVKGNIEAFMMAGIHVELTNLVVTGLNDKPEEFTAMIDWIVIVLISNEIPVHVTRYFPARNHHEHPTSLEALNIFASIATKKLKYVHIGNV